MLNVLQFVGFLVFYGVWIGLSGWALQRIMRGQMWPTYMVGALFWLVPPAILYLLTGKFDATFVLLTGAALPVMFLLGAMLRRFYGAPWQLLASLYRIGMTIGARQGWRGCISQVITALVMLAYPILVGIWFFGDAPGNAEKIIQATFVLFVYLYLADVNTVLMLASPDTPPKAHSFLLWNRVLGLLPAGLMLALILASLDDGTGQLTADLGIVGAVLAVFLLLSVVPYLIGWVRARRRRMRGLADRQRLMRAAAESVEAAGSGQVDEERILSAFEARLDAIGSRELVLRDVAQQLVDEADVSLAAEHQVRDLIRDVVKRRGMDVLMAHDPDFAQAMLNEVNGKIESVEFAIEQYAVTLLPDQERTIADDEIDWWSGWMNRIEQTYQELPTASSPAERRALARAEAAAMRQEVAELEKQRDTLRGRRPVAAIAASVGAAAYSAGAGQLGEWAWALAADFLG